MRVLLAGLSLAAVVLGTSSVMAQETDGWSGKATLYGWLPVINGAQEGPDGQPLVDLETSDVLSRLDLVAMGGFELRRGRFGLLLDAMYADLGSEAAWRQGGLAVSTDTKIGMYTLATAYRASEGPHHSVDVYAGARFFESKLDFGIATGLGGRTASADLSWSDPIVGLRGAYALDDRWTLRGFVDAGGFDTSSDLSWQAYAGASYALNDRWEAAFGYRYLSVLYEASDRAKLDVDVQGPLVAIGYRF